MMIIKLIHPVHGLVAQQVLTYNQTKHKSIKEWKYKYGKKFNECAIALEGEQVYTRKGNQGSKKRVINIKTGEVYSSITEAAKETGTTHQSVYVQCKRKYTIGYDYKFKYA